MKKLTLTLTLTLVLLVGCVTGLQNRWDSATETERARIILADMQAVVDSALDSGKLYIAIHPEKKDDWQRKVVPIFDLANQSIYGLIKKIEAGLPITTADVYAEVNTRLNEVIAILTAWGVVVEKKK